MTNSNEERPAAEHNELVELLSSLPRVEAPGDFYFRVKARIAEGSSLEPSLWRIPAWLKYAMPLALIVAVGLYLGSAALRSANQPAAIAVSAPASTVNPASETRAAVGIPDADTSAAAPSTQVTGPAVVKMEPATTRIKNAPAAARRSNSTIVTQPAGGSVDQALRGSSRKITPPGLSAERIEVPAGVPGFESGKKITVREVLSQMGVEAEPRGTGWLVRSARPDSPAQRSGLKAGDIIEAIGDQRIGRDTLLVGSFSGSVLSVRRDGRQITVSVGNK